MQHIILLEKGALDINHHLSQALAYDFKSRKQDMGGKRGKDNRWRSI